MTKAARPKSILSFDAGLVVAGLDSPTVITININDIVVVDQFNPRGRYSPHDQAFNEDSLRSLGESLKNDGVLSPILVSEVENEPGRYQLIAGERRLRAARLVGLQHLPATLKSDQDAWRLALLENLQRENLNPVDETFGVLQLLARETDLALEDVPGALRAAARSGAEDPYHLAAKLRAYGGHSLEAWARHRLAFLKMTPEELDVLRSQALPWRTVAELVRLGDHEGRTGLLEQAVHQQLSHTQVRQNVNQLLGQVNASPDIRRLLKGVSFKTIMQLPDAERQQAQVLLTKLQSLLQNATP
jgi:ParB family chromosome partitioning protein